jgi:hypothetical protein
VYEKRIIFCGQLAGINLDSWTLDKLLFTNLIFLASTINFWICRISLLFVFFFSKYIFVSFSSSDSASARHFRHWRLIFESDEYFPYVQYNYDAGMSLQWYELTIKLYLSSSSSNKVQATVVDDRTGTCGARKTMYRWSHFIYNVRLKTSSRSCVWWWWPGSGTWSSR